MIADAINCTHDGTGGSGTLTLAGRTGYPQPTDVWGSSLTKFVNYEIAEYTDSTFATLSKYERGIGSIVLSTNVLTRTIPHVTWSSGGSWNGSSASALSFGNTAANIIITLTAHANCLRPAMPSMTIQGDGWKQFNTRQGFTSGAGAFTMVADEGIFCLVEYTSPGPITSVGIEVTTLASSKIVRLGVYDVNPSTSYPGNLLTEFTSASQFSSTTTGFKTVTPGSPYWLPSGWYWLAWVSDGTPAIRTLDVTGDAGWGSSSTRDLIMGKKTSWGSGSMPATGPTSFSSTLSLSGGKPLWAGFK